MASGGGPLRWNLADADNIPPGNVRVILVGYSVRMDVPDTMTIKELREELYVSALSSGRSITFSDRSPEALRKRYCDYEFVLVRGKKGDRVRWLPPAGDALDDASMCRDHVTPGHPALLYVQPKFIGVYSGSIRTVVPGDYEREEKQAFMITVRNLPQMNFNLVALAVGANTPEQVLPNFAIDAARLGYKVCILAINPGFYHGIYPSLKDLLLGSLMSRMSFLAYNRHPPSHDCTTVYDRARAWESWQTTQRGDFAGSFALTPAGVDNLNGGYMEMHTFAMSWPGKPANRDLDNAVLLTVSQTIPFLCTTTCHFVAFFSTWSDETDFHITHLCRWRGEVPFFNSFHAILDNYYGGGLHVFRNIDLAISCTSHLHDDEMLQALGGRRISKFADVSLDDLGFFEVLQ